jgi:hypothetical protein
MKTLLELDDWDRLQEIFDQASNLHGDDRKLYLEAACADSAKLRLVAESLLFSQKTP